MHITREYSDDQDIVTLSRNGIQEHIICSYPSKDDGVAVFRSFPPPGMEIVNQYVFGGSRYYEGAEAALGHRHWPMTWVHGDVCGGNCLSSCQSLAVSGAQVSDVELDGNIVGRVYEDRDAKYCYLGGVTPEDISLSREEQARSVFERLEAALNSIGMEFTDIVRTWLYICNMLDWYGEFNKVRTEFFTEKEVFDHLLPASTGIGGANPQGGAVAAAALAILPKHQGLLAFPVISPLQCPATDYQSSFSRAVEVHQPGRRTLYISGTASIDVDGNTQHVGDVQRQIVRTMEVLDALLKSRGMGWADVTRMIAYFYDLKDAALFKDYCTKHHLPKLPAALSHAAICRDDLLFEAELDAVILED